MGKLRRYRIGYEQTRETTKIFCNTSGQFENVVILQNKNGDQGTYIKETNKYAAKHYALFQLVIPVGLGMNYNVSNRVKLGIEIGCGKTFTDYLDDVSGNYTEAKMIDEANGKVAAALSSRTPEISDMPVNMPGQPRGNSKKRFLYLFHNPNQCVDKKSRRLIDGIDFFVSLQCN